MMIFHRSQILIERHIPEMAKARRPLQTGTRTWARSMGRRS